MNCDTARNLMDASVHGELSEKRQRELDAHLGSCEQCREEYAMLRELLQDIDREFPEIEPPPELHARLCARLSQEPAPKRPMGRWVPLASAAAILLAVFFGASLMLGQNHAIAPKTAPYPSAMDDYTSSQWAPTPEPAPGFTQSTEKQDFGMAMGGAAAPESAPPMDERPMDAAGHVADRVSMNSQASARKLIKDAQLSMETQAFDTTLTQLQSQIDAIGGYVQNLNVDGMPLDEKNPDMVRGRTAYVNARVPAESMEMFLAEAEGLGKVIYRSQNGSDVTQQYQDTAARLEAYTTQRDRLLSLLEKAQAVEDLILLENELSRVQYEVEYYTQQLTDMDRRVAESTVTLNISEVRSSTAVRTLDPTLGERIQEGFVATINAITRGAQDILVWLVANSPILISIAIVALVLWFAVIRRWIKKRRQP